MVGISKQKLAMMFIGLLAVGLIVFWLIFAQKGKELKCNRVEIRIYPEDELFFVTSQRVQELLMDEQRQSPVGKPLKTLNLKYLEGRIKRHPAVEKANVYTHLDGRLIAEVWQKEPIIRIHAGNGYGYYLDKSGHEFPLSKQYSARVMVATGNIDTAVVRKLYTLACFVHENPFWKAQIEQIFVNDGKDLILIPKVGRSKLIIGDTERLEEKLNDLRIVQKDALTAVGWNKYSSINVKFKDVVICK
jgi:cell division protein FtsQ